MHTASTQGCWEYHRQVTRPETNLVVSLKFDGKVGNRTTLSYKQRKSLSTVLSTSTSRSSAILYLSLPPPPSPPGGAGEDRIFEAGGFLVTHVTSALTVVQKNSVINNNIN